jgi:multidrug efflux pump
MAISRFFVARPIFAWVVAAVVMLIGIGAILKLPIARFPDVAPPHVSVRTSYPGASAETLEGSVTSILEQQITGIDGLAYFESTSDSSGSVDIGITFNQGINPDVAQVQVQNRVQQAISRLPQEVQQQGLVVTKENPDFLLFVTLYDSSDRATPSDISDYTVSQFQDDIARVPGVGQVEPFTAGHAMRIWLDPFKLAAVKLMPSDVASAVAAQNVDLSVGQIGQLPSVKGQMRSAVVKAKSRLQTPDQFRDIVLKARPDGSVVRVSDVARVEIGQEDYSTTVRFDGHPASGLSVSLAPGADALKTSAAVKARATELGGHMPPGYVLAFPRDTSDFVRLSIREVVETLFAAIVFVVLVMYAFLQSWRATLVPAVAVPVVLLGTFGVLAALGYSINTLTLFAMVLAIGLLVDDAIVVVENVERIMAQEGLGPREATLRSMGELGSALVGVALVLCAVMAPMAFFGGSTGVIYRQFSVTIISAMLLSVAVALVLSPALCAALLKPPSAGAAAGRGVFGRFNRGLERIAATCVAWVERLVVKPAPALAVYVLLLMLLMPLFLRLPTAFLPAEDQGQVFAQFTLPAGATAERTGKVLTPVERYFRSDERRGVAHLFTSLGSGLSASGQNTGGAFATLRPFGDRDLFKDSAEAIAHRATAALGGIRDAEFFATTPPPISGLGQSNGFSLQLLNRSGVPHSQFVRLRDAIVAAAAHDPKLASVRAVDLADTPQFRIHIDDSKLAVLGLTEADVTSTLTAAWGGRYVGDFIDRGRVKRVYMQADAPFRSLPSNLDSWFVRGVTSGAMVPFSAFAHSSWETGPTTLSRFNGRASYEIDGEAGPGVSSGDAMKAIVALQRSVAPQLGYAWSGLSRQETQASGQALWLYVLSVAMVFLCLAALYESWSVPLSVLLAIPLGIVGAVLAVTLRGGSNNIYFQVGLLTTMGLAAKNAILIVEFAEHSIRNGDDLVHAALEAARLRLRPVIMTSTALVAGIMPLVFAAGAGAQSRIAIGTSVVGGVLSATLLSVFYVPLFFVGVGRLSRRGRASRSEIV